MFYLDRFDQILVFLSDNRDNWVSGKEQKAVLFYSTRFCWIQFLFHQFLFNTYICLLYYMYICQRNKLDVSVVFSEEILFRMNFSSAENWDMWQWRKMVGIVVLSVSFLLKIFCFHQQRERCVVVHIGEGWSFIFVRNLLNIDLVLSSKRNIW